jgi:hypothetical protein
MSSRNKTIVLLMACALVLVAAVAQAQESKLTFSGTVYTKWLWGNAQNDGSLYNFTTVPGEGYGDNGQGSEIELMPHAKLSNKVEVKARIHSRFSQNEWTNFGGFGGDAAADGTGGNRGEFDPRSNQYVKLRGMTVILTPGYDWLDAATIGASDWGMFDPFTIGKIRYIDRDNGSGLLFQGSAVQKNFKWDAARISLPRLWAGPGYKTGNYASSDAAYGLQTKYTINDKVDVGAAAEVVNDIEIDPKDGNWDNGRRVDNRFRNDVYGLKAGVHPSTMFDIKAAWYYSFSEVSKTYAESYYTFGLNGYSSVPGGKREDAACKLNVDVNDPFGVGLSFNVEGFDIGSDYVSMMAARRESDVLLTEGHDGSWAFPGPSNAAYGVFGGNPTRIGYGGWNGNAQQVATINVDNEFSDFDEPMAETVIGWKGVTIAPLYGKGNLDLAAEYTYLTYNTNWQAYGDDTRSLGATWYPAAELDTGVGHNFRSAYAPFQDKKTNIGLVKGKYTLDVGKGLEVFGKVKYIKETDDRMTDPKYLPYDASGNPINYYGTNTTNGTIYAGFPGDVTVDGVTGKQWKPFTSVEDDDRDLKYTLINVGGGYQLTEDLYGTLAFSHYTIDLTDGNTAFQAYRLHEMAGGKHNKNQLDAKFRYALSGTELGFEYQINFGTYEPDFGDGFVVQKATQDDANNVHVRVGSRGFRGAYGNWNSLEKRTFEQQRIKAFLKVQF